MASFFHQSMDNLIKLSKEIIEYNSLGDVTILKKGGKKAKNPIMKCLANYQTDYDLSSEEGNKEDVLMTYHKIKAALLRGYKFDDWLKNAKITIYSGAAEPDDERKIMLTAIYNLACRHRDQTQEALKGLPVESFEGRVELLFPGKFMLYMYRVFLFALNKEENPDDVTKLEAIVADLEKELNIPALTEGGDKGKGEAKNENGNNNLVDGFLGIAKDLVAKMGIQVPDGIQLPSNSNDVMKTVSSVFTQPETKDFIADIGETMKESKDLGDAFQKVLSKFQDPKQMEKIKNMAKGMSPSLIEGGSTSN